MRTAVLFFFVTLIASCDGSLCANELIAEIPSVDRRYIASIFQRNCGATTPYVRVVSLRPTHTKFAPDNDKDWVFTIHGQSDISASWTPGGELVVSYTGTGDSPTKRASWHGVAISFR